MTAKELNEQMWYNNPHVIYDANLAERFLQEFDTKDIDENDVTWYFIEWLVSQGLEDEIVE